MSPPDPALRLANRFTHLVSIDDAVVLVGDEDGFLLESPLVVDTIKLVDGRRTAVHIVGLLEEIHPPAMVHFVLLKLEGEGVLDSASDLEEEARWGSDGSPEDEHVESLAGRLREAWERRANGAVVTLLLAEGQDAEKTLLLTDDYLSPRLLELRQSLPGNGAPVLLARIGPRSVWVGPWIQEGTTACVSCLQERLRVNLLARATLHFRGEEEGRRSVLLEPLRQAVPEGAWRMLARAVSGEQRGMSSPGRIRVVRPKVETEELHLVARLPHCPHCGDPSVGPPGAGFALRPAPLVDSSDTGYRTAPLEATLRSLQPHLSPLTGVIRYARRVPLTASNAVYVYTAGHAHSYGAASLRTLRSDRRDHSGGKGMSDLEARVSAMGEAVERFSSVHRGTEEVRRARISELGSAAIHPHELLLFSEAQYEGRGAWNADHRGGFQWVPQPYRDEPMEWSLARSLVSGETRWVPSAAVYLAFSGAGRRFYTGDSNGLASGNCLEEALLQGLLELVERDAVALWWYNRVLRPGLTLESFPDPRVSETASLYSRLGRRLWALDLTSDLGIPTFAALSSRNGAGGQDIIFGFGAHLDPRIALLRAMAELNQMLPTVERTLEERRRQLLPDFWEAIRWWETARLEEHSFLMPDSGAPPRTSSDFHQPAHHDLLTALRDAVGRVKEAGCDVLAHDLTRPDVGFPVARVMAPGLRHFWRRLGPGRLYDVPVGLGWCEAPRREEEMNPVSMFV